MIHLFALQLNGFKQGEQFNNYIWTIDGTLQLQFLRASGPGSNSIVGVLNVSQSSRTETSASIGLVSYPGHSRGRGTLQINTRKNFLEIISIF